MNNVSFLRLFSNYVSPLLLFVSFLSYPPFPLFSFLLCPHPSLHVSILCLYASLPPSSPRPLPVSVYEGKFIGLPGAVSWRWPPLLKNHNKASPSIWKRDSVVGILGYFHQPTLHLITHTLASHYLLMSLTVFFLLSPRDPASYPHMSQKWLPAFCLLFFILYSSI